MDVPRPGDLSARAKNLRRSSIRLLFDAADRHPGAVRLEVGEPSFATPRHVVEAAAAAAVAGHTGYGPNGGLLPLRELLHEKVRRVNGIETSTDGIVVTPGAMNALYSLYLALLEPGDEVLLPTPGFPNMDEMVRLVGGTPVFYELRAEDHYLPDIDRIASLVTERTKAIFVNTPSNPTGAVFPPDLVKQLVVAASERGIWIVSDEVYDELILDSGCDYLSPGAVDPEAPVVSVFSFSKTYAMTGWRVGYVVAPPPLAEVLRTLQEPQVSCPSTISQKAAEAALTGPRGPYEAMREAYIRRRDLAWDLVGELGLDGSRPSGTFYMLLDISRSGMAPLQFALRLLDEQGVAIAPGEVFGPGGHRVVRISLANDEDQITRGLQAIAALVG